MVRTRGLSSVHALLWCSRAVGLNVLKAEAMDIHRNSVAPSAAIVLIF